jgi:hypothetical protein
MKPKHQPERGSWSYRPHFTPRQLLTADQLNAGLNDELFRQQLLSRAVHGYGVVTGLGPRANDCGELEVERGCFHLSGGLALDRLGRMLYWAGGRIGLRDIVGELPDCPGHYTLSAHYAIQRRRPPGCHPFDDERTNWWWQGVVFTLRPYCGHVGRDCPDHPEGACPGHDHYLCRRTGAISGDRPGDIPVSDDVAWVLAEPGPLCPTDDGWWEYDPDPEVCVPIGCFQICDLANDDHGHPRAEQGTAESSGAGPVQSPEPASDAPNKPDESGRDERQTPCEPRYGFCRMPVEACRVRPLVYRNPLLYELANCCDVELARVERVSWQDWIDRGWSTPVPWDEFERRITEAASYRPGEGSGRQGFEIWFSHPIEVATINDASIFLTAVVAEKRADYLTYERVPMRDLTLLGQDGDLARGVRLVPANDWIRAEITGRRSTLFDGAYFELTIRGQLLRDRCHQQLDARSLDIADDARCQARPGGDFVSVFQVGRRHGRPDHEDEHDETAEHEGKAADADQPAPPATDPVDTDATTQTGQSDR